MDPKLESDYIRLLDTEIELLTISEPKDYELFAKTIQCITDLKGEVPNSLKARVLVLKTYRDIITIDDETTRDALLARIADIFLSIQVKEMDPKLQADYVELLNAELARFPVAKPEDYDLIVEALRSLIDTNGKHVVDPSLQETISSITFIFDNPDLYVEKPENYPIYQRLLRDRITEYIDVLLSKSLDEKNINIQEDQERKKLTEQNRKIMAQSRPPVAGSEAHVLSEAEWLAEMQMRDDSEIYDNSSTRNDDFILSGHEPSAGVQSVMGNIVNTQGIPDQEPYLHSARPGGSRGITFINIEAGSLGLNIHETIEVFGSGVSTSADETIRPNFSDSDDPEPPIAA